MDEIQLAEHRKQRLQDFATKKFEGSKAALGRALGYRDGAFVGQMLRGERPITEKTIAQVHRLPGGSGWFDVGNTHPEEDHDDPRWSDEYQDAFESITNLVMKVGPLRTKSARTALHQWVDGELTVEEAMATINALVAASVDDPPKRSAYSGGGYTDPGKLKANG